MRAENEMLHKIFKKNWDSADINEIKANRLTQTLILRKSPFSCCVN